MRKIVDENASMISTVELDRFNLMRNAARTRRCHTQMVIHHQSVGEHTFGALAILDIVAPDCRKEVWRALLFHDAPEAITGDVPAPAKWRFHNLEKALRDAEQIIMDDHWINNELYENEHKLCKLADIMELVWYGIEELRMGNRGVMPMITAALGAVSQRKLYTISVRSRHFFQFSIRNYVALGGKDDGFCTE